LGAGSTSGVETVALRDWDQYRAIMWIGDSARQKPAQLPLFYQRLREMGINTAMVYGGGDPAPLLESHFPYYVENIINRGLCLKYSSKVRDWDRFITAWAKTREPEELVRDYCLDDPVWRDWAKNEMRSVVRKNLGHNPLAYNIRDELSTTISANPFDFDFSPLALAKFRDWLKTQYADLADLNRQWETSFADWDQVRPFTTDQIKNRMASGSALPKGQPDWQVLQKLTFDPATARQSPTRWNFSPWADFRTYMDLSLAGTLDDLRQAAHELDPHTPVGIEGTQMPSAFGGYDLWRLAKVLDWVEPYDIANAREIFGSFMPRRPILTTVFESDTDHARRRLWHLLLSGDRGCIIWWSEDCIDWQSTDYALTPKAKALAPVLREMASPLARLFLRAERQFDPIAFHYSQASIQVDWLLESCADGSTWLRRFSTFEADHNRQARVRNSWLKAFQDLGFSPRFLATEQIESSELENGGYQVLVMPCSLALSAKEAGQIGRFLGQNSGQPGTVFCDGLPGLFDEHGRLQTVNTLEKFFPAVGSTKGSFVRGPRAHSANAPDGTADFARGTPIKHEGDIAHYTGQRLQMAPPQDWPEWIERHIPLPRPVTVSAREGDPGSARAAVFRYRLGKAQLLAFERNIDYQMSEDLKQAGGNQNLEKPVELEAEWIAPAHAYDLRSGTYLGRTNRITITLNPWQPSLFALLPEQIPAESLIESLLKQ
jgi:hypothetical protein